MVEIWLLGMMDGDGAYGLENLGSDEEPARLGDTNGNQHSNDSAWWSRGTRGLRWSWCDEGEAGGKMKPKGL